MQAMGAKLLRTRFRRTPRAGLSQHTPASLAWRPTDLYMDRKFDDAGSNLRVQTIQKEYQLQFSLHRCGADGIMKDSPASSSKVVPKFATQLIHLQFPRFDVSPINAGHGSETLTGPLT